MPVFLLKNARILQGGFLTGSAQKVPSIRLHRTFLMGFTKCQNLLTGWHLEHLGRNQSNKPPCISFIMCEICLSCYDSLLIIRDDMLIVAMNSS